MDMSLSRLQEMVKGRDTWPAAVHGVTESDVTGTLNSNNDKEENSHNNLNGCEQRKHLIKILLHLL